MDAHLRPRCGDDHASLKALRLGTLTTRVSGRPALCQHVKGLLRNHVRVICVSLVALSVWSVRRRTEEKEREASSS